MSFNDLNLAKPILQALERKGYTEPSPIQEKTIPLLLEDHDIIGIAQTGTGKTAAFAIPILNKLFDKYGIARFKTPRALILAPTRELAAQIEVSLKDYGKFLKFRSSAVFGGVRIGNQIKTLQRGVDILVATPGRLMDLMNQDKVILDNIEFLVLDEADRMLDMGFLPDVRKIVSSLPVERQSLFFSATMNSAITKLTTDFLKDPVKIEVTPEATPVDKIAQSVFFVDNKDKDDLLVELVRKDEVGKTIVFVGMKHRADKIVRVLSKAGIRAESIHGDKAQGQRVRALSNFKKGKSSVMVATDIAARGIDVRDITHVVNYDLPNEPENYVHRIGRTARAGKDGVAHSFCCARDKNFLEQIQRTIRMKIDVAEHEFHSVRARNAEGADAKPMPRGRGRNPGRARTNPDGSYRRPVPGPSGRPKRSRDGARSGRRDSKDNNRDKPRRGRNEDRSRSARSGSGRKKAIEGRSPRSGSGRRKVSREDSSKSKRFEEGKPKRGDKSNNRDRSRRVSSRNGDRSEPTRRGFKSGGPRGRNASLKKSSRGPRRSQESFSRDKSRKGVSRGGKGFGRRDDGRSRSGKSVARTRARR